MNPVQMIQPSQEKLIERASQGDLDSFNQLVLLYQDMAYNHARALIDDPTLAEDAVQDSFIKVFQNIHTFRGGSLRGWLLKIVTNSVYDIARRSLRHPSQPLYPQDEYGEEIESAAWLSDPGAFVEEAVEREETSREIYRALDDLPAEYRSVLHLIDVQELDYTEVARILQIPLGTVKSRLARARMRLRDSLRALAGYEGRSATTYASFSLPAKSGESS